MRIKNPPLILDNTVISRYGLIDRFDILEKLYSKIIIIPTNVIIESIALSPLEKCVQKALQAGWMEEYTLHYTESQNELKEYLKLRRQFGDGESATMAIAKTWQCALASDDMRATKKYCAANGIEQIGSLGILYDAYESGIIDAIEGDKLLKDMISKSQYTCPVNSFQSVIDWFEKCIGRELF